MINYNLFTDEVFYYDQAINNSFWSILTSSHWIKDHGILSFLIIKKLSFIINDPIKLRLFNLIIYGLISIISFKFFKKHYSGLSSLIFNLLYAFSTYFIYMESMLSPFNYSFFFIFLTIITILNLIDKKINLSNIFQIAILTVLAFYCDYSSINLIFLLISYCLIYFLIKKKSSYQYLTLSILLFFSIIVYIFPVIIFLINNLTFIKDTTQNNLLTFNIFEYILDFNNILFTRKYAFLSTGLFLVFNYLLIYIIIKSNIIIEKFIGLLVTINLFFNYVYIFIFSNIIFNIYIERSFNLIYLLQILGLSLIIWYFRNKLIIILILLLLIATLFSYRLLYHSNKFYNGIVPNIHYQKMINQFKKDKILLMYPILVYDNKKKHVPLKDYYFKKENIQIYKLIKNKNEIKNYFYKNYILINAKDDSLTLPINSFIKIFQLKCYINDCYFE